jgi:hypothetical protein
MSKLFRYGTNCTTHSKPRPIWWPLIALGLLVLISLTVKLAMIRTENTYNEFVAPVVVR